jgi:hypothetical protein
MVDALTSAGRELVIDYGISDLMLELWCHSIIATKMFAPFALCLQAPDIVHELQRL